MRLSLRSCHRSCLAPVEDEFAFGVIPASVELCEGVEITERGDHDLVGAVFGVDMVGDRVALSARAVTVEDHGALAVEMCGGLVAVEVFEDRGERIASV